MGLRNCFKTFADSSISTVWKNKSGDEPASPLRMTAQWRHRPGRGVWHPGGPGTQTKAGPQSTHPNGLFAITNSVHDVYRAPAVLISYTIVFLFLPCRVRCVYEERREFESGISHIAFECNSRWVPTFQSASDSQS